MKEAITVVEEGFRRIIEQKLETLLVSAVNGVITITFERRLRQ